MNEQLPHRPIRSFVRREGRMTDAQRHALEDFRGDDGSRRNDQHELGAGTARAGRELLVQRALGVVPEEECRRHAGRIAKRAARARVHHPHLIQRAGRFVVELRAFGGLTIEETACVLNVSGTTVKREWRTAKAWLTRELGLEAQA